MASEHLETRINKNHGSATMQVAFLDIVGYSKRKSTVQFALIQEFTRLVTDSLHHVGQKFLQYAQAHNANFANDIIRIPTGDGIAVVFTFDGLESIALDFVESLLEKIHNHNNAAPCAKFEQDGWCNCHPYFRVRVGVSEGKGIVYKDVNGSYNVAGATINLAARVMGRAEASQVFFTREAYKNLVDMTTDTTLEERFKLYSDVRIKHGFKVDIYQYRPSDRVYISSTEPEELVLLQEMVSAQSMFMPGLRALLYSTDGKVINTFIRDFMKLQTQFTQVLQGAPPGGIVPIPASDIPKIDV